MMNDDKLRELSEQGDRDDLAAAWAERRAEWNDRETPRDPCYRMIHTPTAEEALAAAKVDEALTAASEKFLRDEYDRYTEIEDEDDRRAGRPPLRHLTYDEAGARIRPSRPREIYPREE